MLRNFLVSGWFGVKPFVKYIVVLMMLAPLVGGSVNTSAGKQVDKGNIKLGYGKSKSQVLENYLSQNLSKSKKPLRFNQYVLLNEVSLEKGNVVNGSNQNNAQGRKDSTVLGQEIENYSGKVETIQLELIPLEIDKNNSHIVAEKSQDSQVNQQNQQQEKNGNSDDTNLTKVKVLPNNARGVEIPVNEQISTDGPPQNGEIVQNDPIGSPHPIPWQWIMKTQENIGGQGKSGVRYYRSIPVISADGRYAIYSRVEMTVKPEMHNSRVNSALFIEDRQTKRLKVLLTTNPMNDPLLNKQEKLSEEMPNDGKIAVLVPVSWSKTGDRFLARKFVAVFNTADATDQAVIWNRQNNNVKTISLNEEQQDREKIAILLGWSKNQPNNVLFRSGELGSENWPLVQVDNDGKVMELAAEADQAVTFGDRGKIWADPQLASR